MPDFLKRRPPSPGDAEPGGPGPDFSGIRSRDQAESAAIAGTLEPLYLLPPELGGTDDPRNVLYVPIGVADAKRRIDLDVVAPLVEDGSVTQYRCHPEYQGDSFVPIALSIRAWEPREFTATIDIWGTALPRRP